MTKEDWILNKLLLTFGGFVCALKGHRRGKLVDVTYDTGADGRPLHTIGLRFFRCPRCGATWERKVSAKGAA